MIPKILSNGNMLVPYSKFEDNVLSDGKKEITPDSQEYKDWILWGLNRGYVFPSENLNSGKNVDDSLNIIGN